jgi:antibiotic biosynthesis monooxygenase (ABM) superfamily enzyme
METSTGSVAAIPASVDAPATGTASPTASEATPTPPTPHAPPSVHVRAVITWLAIFPLVALGMTIIGPISDAWPPVLRALALTAVVVPLAVYLVVPQLLRAYGALRRRGPRSGAGA